MADQKTNDTPGGSTAAQVPLNSVYTSNLPAILDHFGISLAVSTYQAGKVIVVRNDGKGINTHFRSFNKPMGMAVDGQRLTVGGKNTVWYYRNMPALAPKLEPRAATTRPTSPARCTSPATGVYVGFGAAGAC